MLTITRVLLVVAFTVGISLSVSAEEIKLRVCSWNVESGDADPNVIARRIAGEKGVDLWGLSEVESDQDAKKYEHAAEEGEDADFKRVVGTTGRSDKLVVIYNAERLKKVRTTELHHINVGGSVRSPLVVEFEGMTTKKRFLFMVNHLYRSKPQRRHQQAKLLNEWAKQQTLPIIAVGDYNADWHYQTGDVDHDKAYDLVTEDSVFTWVRPSTLFPTQDSRHESVLDFVFVSGDATGWKYESTILKKRGDFPDNNKKSDHRPVDATFVYDTELDSDALGGDERSMSKGQILNRIEEIEKEIKRLRELIEKE